MQASIRLPQINLRSLGLSWPLLVALAVCVGFLAGPTTQILGDPDTYLHVASGRWMLQHQRVPGVDVFSQTMAGQPWIAHEWLAQSLMALVYDLCGWTGLVLLAVSSLALTLAYLLRFLLRTMPPIYALLFAALACCALAPHLLARPHVLAWPILALWAGTLAAASEQGRAPPHWLAGLMLVWANLHGSFTLGLVLGLVFAFEAVISSTPERRWQTVKPWCAFLGLALLAAMLTPAGWRGLWFTFHLVNLKHLDMIGEWMPASFTTFNPIELWLVALLGLALTGYLRLPVFRLLLVLGLLHQALLHGRYVSLFGLIVPMLIAAPFGKLYPTLSHGAPQASTLDQFFDTLAAPAGRSTITVIAALVLLTGVVTAQTGRHRPAASISPSAALDAALRSGVSGPVLNSYDFGGYLVYRGIPVFVDGRADLYGDRHLDAYLDVIASNKAEKIQKVLADFKITWTLLPPGSATLLYLNTRPEWRKVYEDETAVVHIRQPPS